MLIKNNFITCSENDVIMLAIAYPLPGLPSSLWPALIAHGFWEESLSLVPKKLGQIHVYHCLYIPFHVTSLRFEDAVESELFTGNSLNGPILISLSRPEKAVVFLDAVNTR